MQIRETGIYAAALIAMSGMIASLESAAGEFQPRTSVSIADQQWLLNGQPAHAGSQAEGLLMNVRMINVAFEDTGPAAKNLPEGFDPDENTDRFLQALPEYVQHGMRAFTVGLQGGMPGYEGAVNSAFEADGSLRPGYMARIARVIEACDETGAVVILSCFYQRQHSHERALAGQQAMLNAVANAARWVKQRGYTNVVLEVANEYPHGGFRNWNDGDWLRSPAGQVELIERAREAAPELLISTSGAGGGTVHDEVAKASDFVTIHFNNTPVAEIPDRVERARQHGKPVICNEDDKIAEQGAAAARASVESGAAWGFMHLRKNQTVPFEFDGAADDPAVYQAIGELTSAR